METSLIFPVIMLVICIIAFCFITYFMDICHENKAIERQLNSGNKVWCFYTVQDSATRKDLILGYKYRTFNDLVQVGETFYNPGKRKIFIYETRREIKGVDCVITFYANVYRRANETPCFIVEPDGEKLFFDNDSENA